MTIDPPHEQERQDELEWVLDETPVNGGALAEDHVEAIHRGLNDDITESNPYDIDASKHADAIAENAERAVKRSAAGIVDRSVAEEAGYRAGEEAREAVLELIREESPRLNDTSQ